MLFEKAFTSTITKPSRPFTSAILRLKTRHVDWLFQIWIEARNPSIKADLKPRLKDSWRDSMARSIVAFQPFKSRIKCQYVSPDRLKLRVTKQSSTLGLTMSWL
jgi:hypothetical protein